MAEHAGKKRTKGSKKTKKGWRKRTDISDIEAHIEDIRKEEREGGIVADKPDDNLFYVDIKAATEQPAKQKKKTKPADDSDDEEQIYISRKERLKRKLAKEEEELRRTKENIVTKSIWGQEKMTVSNAYLEPTIKKAKKMPCTMFLKPPAIDNPAVEVADPGSSYNPDYESHQELLLKAHREELKKIKKQKQLNKKVRMVAVDQLKNKSKTRWMKEMSEGLFFDQPKPDDDDTAQEGEISVQVRPVSAEDRKTRKQKRKKESARNEERQKLAAKKEKLKLNDVYRIKSLTKEIKAEEERKRTKKKNKAMKIQADLRKPKRLSKHKYIDGDTIVQLTEELTGSFREMKPEGNLLEDRFKSLQKRNVIETRKPVVPHRRYKLKEYEKRSHKTKTIKELAQET